jgi:cob(I)alamin adenosyltransferase
MSVTVYTDIIGEKHLPKDHPILECLGTLDELNAFLGDAKAAIHDKPAAEIINEIQKELNICMGVLAGTPLPACGIGTDRLDRLIMELKSELSLMNAFVIPGANPASAKLHIARTVCRRAERRLISLDAADKDSGETIKTLIAPYINRLSNLLFLLACKEAAGGNG